MALIVCARSRDYAEITFKAFADELEENYKKGIYAFKGNESTRITWEGIAVWPHLGHTFKSLKNLNSIMTGSAYPGLGIYTMMPMMNHFILWQKHIQEYT